MSALQDLHLQEWTNYQNNWVVIVIYSTLMISRPCLKGSLNNSTIFLGMCMAPTLQLRHRVRLQIKLLLLKTISWACVRRRLSFPNPWILKVNGSTTKSILIKDWLLLILFFISLDRSEHDLDALTPMIQSPFSVKSGSLVISIVRAWRDRTFLWPQNWISSVNNWATLFILLVNNPLFLE